jgi:hypothetical protein
LWVATVPVTVTAMTSVSPRGIRRSVAGAIECQSNVETATRIITATSAAIGITATRLPSPTTRRSSNAPAAKVEIRVRARLTRTLIIVWPIIAQPAMPPNRPVTTLAIPCPRDSRSLSEGVSVMSSTSLAVISDSSSPTAARVNEYGAMIRSVSSENGTAGMPSTGSALGSSPSSPTVGTAIPAATQTTVRTTIAISGAGTAVVTRGSR